MGIRVADRSDQKTGEGMPRITRNGPKKLDLGQTGSKNRGGRPTGKTDGPDGKWIRDFRARSRRPGRRGFCRKPAKKSPRRYSEPPPCRVASPFHRYSFSVMSFRVVLANSAPQRETGGNFSGSRPRRCGASSRAGHAGSAAGGRRES